MANHAGREVVGRRLLESLQSDLKALSIEAKKKHCPVKEASESCLLKLRLMSQQSQDLLADLLSQCGDVVQPFIMGCDSKIPKMVHISLTAMQRMIQHEVVSATTADNIIKTMWNLMNAGVEELKLLQTTILMITTNSIAQHESLAKALVLGFRLYFTKDSTTINTAGATVRQLVSVVFERVTKEDSVMSQEPLEEFCVEKLKVSCKTAPGSLRPCAQDGFLLFQDLCQLVNADNPHWLVGITEMTRTFGLELLELVMSNYPRIFLSHPEFTFLIKERVCPLIIKLFSPSLKYRQSGPASSSTTTLEKPYFPMVMRLLRIVQCLVKSFYSVLMTECEIFLSLLIKFMDCEKPMWQRCIALEVLHRLCSEPLLLRSFVESYDMKPHSAKVFQDIVNSIGAFIQTLFSSALAQQNSREGSKTPDTQGAPPALVAGLPVGSGITPQPAFCYRSIWIPLIMNVPQTNLKPLLIEMLDKLEPPSIPEGYALTLGFATVLDTTRSIEFNILPSTEMPSEDMLLPVCSREVKVETINSSWCHALALFTLLLDASTDEQATDAILKAVQSFITMSGCLGLTFTRDAFVTVLCKASLPLHYASVVLNKVPTQGSKGHHQRAPSTDIKATQDEVSDKSQVVAIGTSLATANMPSGTQVMLTAKNISCMRALLTLAHCQGGILGTSWHMVLTTLQHLVWILGLKAAVGSQVKPEIAAMDNNNAVITTAIMADLPVLSAMLARLFESSHSLDEVALHHLIDALCKLSCEAMEMAYMNREPSLFAVAKILESGLVNLHRVEVLWKPVTAHLLEVCQHSHAAIRGCAVDAVTTLILAALQHPYTPALHDNMRLQAMLLSPLKELTQIAHPDVRQRQLECSLKILQNGGESLGPGWPLVLHVIGDGANTQGEVIIRTAFQSMQLVVTDFLPLITAKSLFICVEMAAKFALQQVELNISLTAIGLLWNISDYFYRQRNKISSDIEKERDSIITSSDELWMCLYSKFGELCIDPRPAVRKSAGQTLFSTVAAHGDLLAKSTWKLLLWKVLFPILDSVKKLMETAPSERERDGPEANILMHHSRDTAQKQWSETQVLIMAGVARVFSIRKNGLEELEDFSRAWAFLLQYVETAALSANGEVSLAALKSLQELVGDPSAREEGAAGSAGMTPNTRKAEQNIPHSDTRSDSAVAMTSNWLAAWKVWLSIGNKSTHFGGANRPQSVPSQSFLCHLVQTFPKLYPHVRYVFVCDMFLDMANVLNSAAVVPVIKEMSPFLVPSNYESTMTVVQENVIAAYECLYKNITNTQASDKLYPKLIQQLMKCSEYCVSVPLFGGLDLKPASSIRGLQAGFIVPSMTEFAEKCMKMASDIYTSVAHIDSVVHEAVLKDIVQSLKLPLSHKHSCPSESSWKLAVVCLSETLKIGLPLTRRPGLVTRYEELWPVLSQTIHEFLFPKQGPPETQSLNDFKADELYDCQVVDLIRVDILPFSEYFSKEFISSVVQLLNKGSLTSASGVGVSGKVRDDFTQRCFETLLQFSFVDKAQGKSAPVSQLAVSTLLTRCATVIKKYMSESKLAASVPVPSQVTEAVSAIRAVSTLLASLKKLPSKSVDKEIWTHVIQLYPSLVSCVHTKSDVVLAELHTALLEYSDLLTFPNQQMSNGT